MKKLSLLICTALTCAPTINAEEHGIKKQTYEASAELGFVMTGGNSDSDTLNAKLKGSTSYHNWKHSLRLEALNSSANDQRSAEKYIAEGQSDFLISDRLYALAVLTWEKDRFSGFDYQASAGLGLGYKIIKEDNINLSVELAPGYRVSELETGDNEEDGIIRAVENFSWKISEASTLTQVLSTEAGDSNTITKFGIGLTNQVAGNLSMKVGINLKHASDVPAGKKKTDRETSVTLVYNI